VNLGKAKDGVPPSAFGRTLQAMIRQQGSQQDFANAIGLSASRVSQLLHGSVSYESFLTLLKGVQDPAQSDHLYSLWVHDFAPRPDPFAQASADSSDDELFLLLSSGRGLVQRGSAKAVLRFAVRLWTKLRGQAHRYGAAMEAGRVAVETALMLNRQLLGLQIAQDMEHLAIQQGDKLLHAHTVWLKSVGVRTLCVDQPLLADANLSVLESALRQWQPHESEARFVHAELTNSLGRDRVLAVWDHCRKQPEDTELLQIRLEVYQRVLEESPSLRVFAIGKEVEARALTALGKTPEAEACLVAASKFDFEEDPFQPLKIRISQIRLLISDNQPDLAGEHLLQVMNIAEAGNLPHYYGELSRLQEILARDYGWLV
jgi:hypothetical protein